MRAHGQTSARYTTSAPPQEFVGACFGMAFSNILSLSGMLPETPSSLGAPLFAELLGEAELAPLLVKFSPVMFLVFFLCAPSDAIGGGQFCLSIMGSAACSFTRGGRPPFHDFGECDDVDLVPL